MQELLIVAGAHLLAVSSPGPDFALVLKNSLSNGRSVGIYTAFGIALGILVHVFYSIVGLAVVISQSIVLFNAIKLVGAAYLIWIGIKSLRSKKQTDEEAIQNKPTETMTNSAAVRQGFLTNVLNPKVTLFFLSLFTQVISTETGVGLKAIYGLEMTVATFVWFTLIAVFMTQKPIRKVYASIRHYIDRLFGVALIALGLRVSLSSR